MPIPWRSSGKGYVRRGQTSSLRNLFTLPYSSREAMVASQALIIATYLKHLSVKSFAHDPSSSSEFNLEPAGATSYSLLSCYLSVLPVHSPRSSSVGFPQKRSTSAIWSRHKSSDCLPAF